MTICCDGGLCSQELWLWRAQEASHPYYIVTHRVHLGIELSRRYAFPSVYQLLLVKSNFDQIQSLTPFFHQFREHLNALSPDTLCIWPLTPSQEALRRRYRYANHSCHSKKAPTHLAPRLCPCTSAFPLASFAYPQIFATLPQTAGSSLFWYLAAAG